MLSNIASSSSSSIGSSSIGSSNIGSSVGNKTNVGHGHGQTLLGSTLTNNTLLASSAAYGDKATAQAARSDETFIANEGDDEDGDGDGDGDEDDDEDEDDITVFTLGFGFTVSIYTYIIRKLLRRLRQIVRD